MAAPKTRQELEQNILSRAAKDPAFRKALISDPKAVLAQDFDVRLPDNVTVKVLEDQPGTVHLVLPPTPSQSRPELANENVEDFAAAAKNTGATAIR